MLDPAYLREHPADVDARLRSRGLDPSADLAELAELETERRRLIPAIENLKRDQNAAGESVARAKREGRDPSEALAANKVRAAQIREQEALLADVERRREARMLTLPNLPHESVPVGRSSADNPEVRRWGTPRTFDFEPKPHWDLGVALGILDFERAARMSGARFSVLTGAGARLARGLINFMLDLHTREHGYLEVEPPFLVNAAALTGTGNLPKFEQDLFRIAGDWDLYLIPTAEVPLTNLHREEILDEATLPLKYTAYTPCFRSEAGLYGADVRGLIRQHQFDKVELVKFTLPEQSLRGARATDAECRDRPRTPRPAVPPRSAVHGRHGVRVGEDLRRGGLAAEPADLPGDLVLQQHRGLPGSPGAHPVPARRRRQAAVRPHAERIGPGGRPDHDRRARERPAGGRVGRDSGCPPGLRGVRRDPRVIGAGPPSRARAIRCRMCDAHSTEGCVSG